MVEFDHELGVVVFDEIASPIATPSGFAGLYFNTSGQLRGLSSNGVTMFPGAIGSKPSTVRITSNVNSISTALADVTGLSFSLATTTNYYFRFYVILQTTDTTNGHFISINGPAATDLCWHLSIPTTRTARTIRFQNTYNGGATTTGLNPANTDFLAVIEGSLTTTASGTLIVRLASETGTSVSVRSGSCGILYTF